MCSRWMTSLRAWASRAMSTPFTRAQERRPFGGAWWHAAWVAACGEVRRRYGQLLHAKCTGVEEDGAGGRQVELNYTMGDINELLHAAPEVQEAQQARERESSACSGGQSCSATRAG